ncbi:class I glutamine amidotransferase-like protein [Leucosporidium creatinivorum]|uniref:Class I glutamine amidotransferase-like protein n=1 Tax=Leucosporidium creatinivorum TaxID=106004 RepID=A0A1Y2C405_9BASI|nr:class I glutamine amidotransferase-like protein [Leucosporidium creatinivorum]
MATPAPLAALQETRRVTLSLPPTAPKPLVILILLADTPVPSVLSTSGTYHSIFSTLLARASALASTQAQANGADPLALGPELVVESYDAVHQVYPTEERVKEADAVLITGSASSAYLPTPWITSLVSYVASLPTLNPTAKIFGICFGHQIVARAFGSTVEVNEKGWEIGVRTLDLSEEGRVLFGGDKLTIHQVHRDHVPSLPPSFACLGSTKACDIHGMVKKVDENLPLSPSNVSIITLQGHPEFTSDIVGKIIDAREKGRVISHELAEESRKFAAETDEGVRIGRVLLSTLGV